MLKINFLFCLILGLAIPNGARGEYGWSPTPESADKSPESPSQEGTAEVDKPSQTYASAYVKSICYKYVHLRKFSSEDIEDLPSLLRGEEDFQITPAFSFNQEGREFYFDRIRKITWDKDKDKSSSSESESCCDLEKMASSQEQSYSRRGRGQTTTCTCILLTGKSSKAQKGEDDEEEEEDEDEDEHKEVIPETEIFYLDSNDYSPSNDMWKCLETFMNSKGRKMKKTSGNELGRRHIRSY